MGYYPDWLGSTFPPQRVDFERFDWIDFAFAVPDADLTLGWDDPAAAQLLKDLVFGAHKVGTKVKLSIGDGQEASISHPLLVRYKQMSFVNNIVAAYQSFALLRSTLPSAARISVAAEAVPFADDEGDAMVDLSGYAEVLDWALIMNYDVWGSSSKPGPNAPLYDACNNSTQPNANAVAAYNAWTAANFPASKLVLGLPSYGYISSSTATHLRTRKWSFERMWDSCSDTPYLRSITSRQIVTYDDPESMLGVNLFDIHGDSEQWDLIDSVEDRFFN
ncbi:glycoside hydrolase [Pholiota molesta]|nr:glycoside hydrolase [Pholiota molesta]